MIKYTKETLIKKLYERVEELGHSPSEHEAYDLQHWARKLFGSWNKAKEAAGLRIHTTPKKRGEKKMNRLKIGKYIMYLGVISAVMFFAGFMIGPYAWFPLAAIFPPVYYLVFAEGAPLVAIAGPLALLLPAAFYLVLGAVIWFSGHSKVKKVRERLVTVDHLIRDIIRTIRELNLSDRYADALNAVRKNLIEYHSTSKYGKEVDAALASIDHTLTQLKIAVSDKNKETIAKNITSLKDTVVDLGYELKH